jgi:hypothetical protein
VVRDAQEEAAEEVAGSGGDGRPAETEALARAPQRDRAESGAGKVGEEKELISGSRWELRASEELFQ